MGTLYCTPERASLPASERCDPTEAPKGFIALPKRLFDHAKGNICRECDWRTTCQDPTTDFLAFGNRCMSHAIRANRDGALYRRIDRCSVVFKADVPASLAQAESLLAKLGETQTALFHHIAK